MRLAFFIAAYFAAMTALFVMLSLAIRGEVRW